MFIRRVLLKRDHPSSLIQIPKFRERLWIVPLNVRGGLYVAAAPEPELGVAAI